MAARAAAEPSLHKPATHRALPVFQPQAHDVDGLTNGTSFAVDTRSSVIHVAGQDWRQFPYSGKAGEFTSATITTTSTIGVVDKTLTFPAAVLLAILLPPPSPPPSPSPCKDKKPKRKCKVNKCNKRKVFKKKCQATCAAHCLEDPEDKKCPKDKKKKCKPSKGGKVDCTDKKIKENCPLSCPVCVLPEPSNVAEPPKAPAGSD